MPAIKNWRYERPGNEATNLVPTFSPKIQEILKLLTDSTYRSLSANDSLLSSIGLEEHCRGGFSVFIASRLGMRLVRLLIKT